MHCASTLLLSSVLTFFGVSECYADSSKQMADSEEPSSASDDSGLFAGVVKTIERDGKVLDCTLYSSGEKCVVIEVVDQKTEEPLQKKD